MKNLFENNYILSLFLGWRLILFLAAFIATLFLSFQISFPYINSELIPTKLPVFIWGFGNFDGVHYLRIARTFYASDFSQAFFPLYPLLIRFLSFGNNYFISGFILSNLAFLGGLYVFYELIKLDFSTTSAKLTLLFLIVFPTSFYFGTIYTESLFLLATVLCLYFMRNGNFIISALFASIASATRVFGFLLVLVFLIEIYWQLKSNGYSFKGLTFLKSFVGLLIAPIGGIIYMVFLKIKFSDALLFLDSQPHFGASRSANFIILPQVFYRYAKILLTVPFHDYSFFTAFLELLFTLFFGILLILTFKKVRLSYWVFSLGCFILPTLTGTFSSMPRYTLMGFLLFPAFIELINQKKNKTRKRNKNLGKFVRVSAMVLLGISEILLTALFIRGYWVA